MARSFGPSDAPRLAEPPVVEELPGGSFRLCAGERRVEAARLAGWTDIPCLVYPPMDPAHAHTLSLLENIHRAAMHPLEEISALCISRLLANADARGVGEQARFLLEDGWERSSSAYEIIRSLDNLLRNAGWIPERPDISWKAHLDDLGISMAPWERKRKLRLLNLEPDLQEKLRHLDITEAALRALGTLESDDQRKVVDALMLNPSLARKVRRVARARRDGFYESIEDALAEVQGGFRSDSQYDASLSTLEPYRIETSSPYIEPGAPSSELEPSQSLVPGNAVSSSQVTERRLSSGGPASPEVQDAVLQLLECADRLATALKSLETYALGAVLPEPWGTWSRDALSFIAGLFPEGAGKLPAETTK